MNLELIADHLRREEELLTETLPAVRALKAAFLEHGLDALAEVAARHQQYLARIDDMKLRRVRLREQLAVALGLKPAQATLARVLERVAPGKREPLQAAAERVRRLVEELVPLNHWLAAHLHVYLGTWHGLLQGLTGTVAGSGRYGPAGKTEATELRPLLQIRG